MNRITINMDEGFSSPLIPLGILAVFLNDIKTNELANRYLEFVEQPTTEWWTENTLIKKINGMINLSTDFGIDWDTQNLVLPSKTFVRILTKWKHLLQENHKGIIITQDGDKITLEGKD